MRYSEKSDLKSSESLKWGRTGFDGIVDLSFARTGHTVKIAKTINAEKADFKHSPALLAA